MSVSPLRNWLQYADHPRLHYADQRHQAWTLTGAGFPLSRSFVTHIDSTFVYQGDGLYAGLFRDAEVSTAIGSHMAKVPGWVEQFSGILDGSMPEIENGGHCHQPFECPTPMGMAAGDPLPVAANLLTSSMFVGDVVTGHDGVTPFLEAARAAGCKTANGVQMVEAVQEMMLDFMLGK